jgi:hypothetical protein
LHGGCNAHGPIFFRTTKLTNILVKSMNKLGGLMQDKVVLVRTKALPTYI